jgi:protein CMS1
MLPSEGNEWQYCPLIPTRALKDGLPNEGVKAPKVGKLFAKHIKIKDAIEFCTREGYVCAIQSCHREASH